jgi:hypothetical protein
MPLLNAGQLSRLVLKVQGEIDAQLALEGARRDEERLRRLEFEAAESGGGVFPTLTGARPGNTFQAQSDGARKVLSIGSGKGGKKTLTTMTFRPIPPVTPVETPPPVETVSRPRSPPLDAFKLEKDMKKMLAWRKENDRPWGNQKAHTKGEVWKYIEMEVPHMIITGEGMGRRKAKARLQGKGEGGRNVPGAG